MGNVSKGLIVLLPVLFLFQFTSRAQASSDYPNKPIQLLVGYAAGGSEDARARALAPKLGEVLGQPVVVVNKPGAGGVVAITLLAKSAPDGYTLGSAATSPILFGPHMQKVEYNPLTDLTYICGVGIQPWAIVVRNDIPWKTLRELIDYIHKNPGKIKYGSWGIGGAGHVHMELFGRAADLKWVHVPFKGDAATITAILGGHIPVAVLASTFVPHAKAGKMTPLAMITENRWPAFPQVPTLKELGFIADYRATESLGYCAPKGLSAEILGKLGNAFKQAVESPEFQQAMEQLDNERRFRDSQEFTKLIHELYPQIGQMIKGVGLLQPGKSP